MSIYTELNSNEKLQNPNGVYQKILSQINPSDTEILDFGCASGYFSKLIKDKYGSTVWGIETDKADASKAKKLIDKVISKNLETANWTNIFKKQKFDAVIFADVLEHLVDPWLTLKKTSQILKPGGKVMISLPNVCHYSVKLSILNNNWQLTNHGIMDKTHLHFFNYNTIVEALESNGYQVESFDPVISQIPNKELLMQLVKSDLEISMGLVRRLFDTESRIFQFVITASIKKNPNYKSFLSPELKHKLLETPNHIFKAKDHNTIFLSLTDMLPRQSHLDHLNLQLDKTMEEISRIKKGKVFKVLNFLQKLHS